MGPSSEPDAPGPGSDDWISYLRRRALLPDGATPTVTELADGVSARVVRVGELVCKQPYAQLRVSGTWLAGIDRVVAEAAALREFESLTPEFVDFDEENRILVQRFVEGANWKRLLLGGTLEPATAAAAGRHLTQVHRADPTPFGPDGPYGSLARLRQLRLDPYFGHAAVQVPHCAAQLDAVVRHLEQSNETVVHGDFSPKNLLVDPADPGGVRILDWEVVHAGAPEFDLAFLVSHLRAKAHHLPGRADEFTYLESEFLGAYRLPFDERWYRRILGALLIARVHGRSPLGYLDPEATAALYDEGVRALTTT